MTKILKAVAVVAVLALLSAFAGCGGAGKAKTKTSFTLKSFEDALKEKGYTIQSSETAPSDFLPTSRWILKTEGQDFTVYAYNSDAVMEQDAKRIDPDGSGYTSGNLLRKSVQVSWIAPVHFFKKGSIIVQTVSGDSKVLADLKSILGEQFAGA